MSTNSLRNHNIAKNTVANTQTPAPPVITGYAISGLDDTALDPAGGQTILINGRGFLRGATVTLNGTAIGVVTWINTGQLSFTSPANTAGTYQIYVVNVDGGTAIYLPGIVYSTFPTWTTSAGTLGSYYETKSISNTVAATGDVPITYSLVSGTLPTGATISSSGVITGTAPADSGSTTYTFTIQADDAQKQSSTRTFSLTINTDVVTWATPSSGATINLDGTAYSQALNATDAAGYSVSYTANTLPTGLTLTSGTISGTPTVEGSTTTLLTATAATTTRSATNTITWVVSMSDLYWKYATTLLTANASSQTSSFISDASNNNAQLTVVGDTRAQNFNPYQLGYYSYYFPASDAGVQWTYQSGSWNIVASGNSWTVEGWIYLIGVSSQTATILASGDGKGGSGFGTQLGINTSLGVDWYWNYSPMYKASTATGVISLNTWTHVAVTCSGTALAIYVNGVSKTLSGTTAQTAVTPGTYLQMSSVGSGPASYFNGYLSNVRLSNIVRYTSNFTPSTTPLVADVNTKYLLAAKNNFNDNGLYQLAGTNNGATLSSANPFTTQYVANTPSYSIYVPGTGVVTATIPAIGTNDFTIEFWMYQQSGESYMFNLGTNWGDTTGVQMIYYATSGNYCLTVGGQNSNYMGGILQNQWVHIAIVRKGSGSGNVVLYYNGVPFSTTFTVTTNLTATSMSLFGPVSGAYWATFNGMISNFRLISGQAIYSGIFNPPSSPLTTTTVGTSGTNVAASLTGTVTFLAANASTFKDGSSNNASFVPSATTIKPVTISPLTSAYYSNWFNGTTDYLTVASNSAFAMGSNNFTIECWFNTASVAGTQVLIDQWNFGSTRFLLRLNTTSLQGYFYTTTTQSISGGTVAAGVWNHAALVRNGSTFTLYLNGVSVGTPVTDSNAIASGTSTLGIGGYASSNYFSGFISNVRIVNGAAIYTTAFTPSTSPLTAVTNTQLLTCQSIYFVDNSSNVFTVTQNGTPKIAAVAPFAQPTGYTGTQITTYGSGYFDGSGDNLAVPSGPFVFGTGNFTVEAWIYTPSYSNGFTGEVVVDDWPNAPGSYLTGQWQFWLDSNGIVRFDYATSASATAYVGTGAAPINQWNHIAVTRSGTTVTVFVNGISSGTGTVSISLGVAYAGSIGRQTSTSNAYYYKGYITDVRVINGTALYTSNFVPGLISPLTNVSNTTLLTLQSNGSHNNSAFNDKSSFNNVITRSGNTTNGTFSPYGDNWSIYFNGSSGFNTISFQTTIASVPLTIEAWVFPTTTTASQTIIGCIPSVTANNRLGVYLSNNQLQLAYTTSSTTQATVNGPSTVVLNTWNHITVCTLANGTVYFGVNGTVTTTTGATFTNCTGSQGSAWYIGQSQSIYDSGFTGYMSNLRVTNNATLYSANYQVPTTPLIASSTTTFLTANTNKFIDSSYNNLAMTVSSTPQIQKFSPFGTVTVPKYYSTRFNGTSDYMTIPQSTSTDLGGGPWTIEAWICITGTTTANKRIVSKQDTSTTPQWIVGVTYPGSVVYATVAYGTTITGSTTLSSNTWYHIAVVRNSNTVTIYVNGTSDGSGSYSGSSDTINAVTAVGAYIGPSEYFPGIISNVRFVKGTAIVPPAGGPTAPLTAVSNTVFLLCQSNTFIENSSNNFTVTPVTTTIKIAQASPFTPTVSTTSAIYNPTILGGSMYFDGTGDYLTRSSINFTTSAFTIEGWFYPMTLDTGRNFWGADNGSSSNPKILCYVDGSSNLTIDMGNAGTTQFPLAVSMSTYGIKVNQWVHIAVVRSDLTSTGFKMYVNGILAGTGQLGTNISNITANFNVGYIGEAYGNPFVGYISDFRITNGTAVYTSNFYPGSAPLTSTYNSILLLNGTSGGIVDQTRTVDFETVGDAKVTKFSPYNGSYYSNYFNGSTSYLEFPNSTALQLGSTYTVEMWAFLNSYGTNPRIFCDGVAGVNNIDICITNSDKKFNLAGGNAISTTYTFPLGTWQHIAVVVNAGAVTVYINGSAITMTGTLTGYNNNVTTTRVVGSYSEANYIWTGYISNVRLIKGQALFSGNFTPSTAPLTTTAVGHTGAGAAASITGTVSLLTCQSNKVIDNSSNNATPVNTSVTQVATQNPFQVNTGISYYFDGTGDCLMTPYSPIFNFGAGNFTIEMWIYGPTPASESYVMSVGPAGAGAANRGWYIACHNGTSTGVWFCPQGAGSMTKLGEWPTANSWHHLAIVRNGTTITGYVDGVALGTTINAGTSAITDIIANDYSYVGAYNLNTGTNGSRLYYNGYITDLRITKGYARTISVPSNPVKTN